MLQHVQCPPVHQQITGCEESGTYSTWPAEGAQCQCGKWDEGGAVATSVYDAIVTPYQNSFLQRVFSQSNVWDVCTGYINLCTFFLDRIGCPNNLRQTINACPGPVNATFPNGFVQNFNGQCVCGGLNQLSANVYYSLIDSLLAQDMTIYIPPPKAPYVSIIGSSPFGQLTTWQRPVNPSV